MSIYKACDIRGKFGSDLTVDHAVRLARALQIITEQRKIVVAGDGRISTPALKETLTNSLQIAGFDVVDLGIIPTPTFYFARRHLGVDLGVMVTASHNPPGDNGFKLTLGALPITLAEMKAIEGWMDDGSAVIPAPQPGRRQSIDLIPDYLRFLAPHTPDLRGLKVIVDCASGMAGLVARQVWAATGADVAYLLDEVDGRFMAHSPNPAEAKNLVYLRDRLLEHGADLGVGYDGDADRVVFMDETGQAVSGDQTIVLFAREMLKQGPQTIVYDQKCSKIVEDAIRALGGEPVMELSGHTFIKRAFIEHNAVYAGELSGHHFFQSVYGDDALAVSMFFARLVKSSRQRLSELTRSVPVYPITPDLRIPMPGSEIQRLLDRLENELGGEAVVTRRDGLRIEWADGWGLVRPSVTEPVITLRFEGIHDAALSRILARVGALAPELRGKLGI